MQATHTIHSLRLLGKLFVFGALLAYGVSVVLTIARAQGAV